MQGLRIDRLTANRITLYRPLMLCLVALGVGIILAGCQAPVAEYVPKTPRQTLLYGYGLVESLSQDVAMARMNLQISAQQQSDAVQKLRRAKQLLDDAKIGLGVSDIGNSSVTSGLQAAIDILTTLQNTLPPPQPAPVSLLPPEGSNP